MAAVSSLVATVVSAVFAVALLRRWAVRGRTPATLWWGLSLVQFCVASVALLLGEVLGWGAPVFRVFYLFGAVTNVLWLGLGTVAINARRRVPSAVTGGVVVLVGLLSLRGATGPDPALWWPSVVVALTLGAAMLLHSARLVQRAAAGVVVTFTAVAAVLVLGSDLVAPIPTGVLPEGRELFPLAVRGMAVAGNAVGSVIVIVGALASSAHAVWRRPDRSADAGLRDVRIADRSVAAALADWFFAGRRGARRAGNVVRGNLLIALGVGLAAASALFAYVGSFLGALIGIELTDAETTGHAVGLAVGVVVMYAGFRRTLAPVEDEDRATALATAGAGGTT
ncbi:MAG: hypothetical protein ACLGIR_09225 [Actinomycetes bacterium]